MADSWKRRSCHFKNVCFRAGTGAGAGVGSWTFVNRYGHLVAPNNLTTSLSPLLMSNMGLSSTGKELKFSILDCNNVSSAAFRALPMRRGVHVLYESYNAENIGHFFGDELWPLFRLANIFHVTDRLDEVQFMRWVDGEPNNPACETKSDRRRCAANYRRMFPLLSQRPLQLLRPKNNVSFCVSDLLVGIGSLSDHCEDRTSHGRLDHKAAVCNDGIAEAAWRFRAHLMRRLERRRGRPFDAEPPPSPSPPPPPPPPPRPPPSLPLNAVNDSSNSTLPLASPAEAPIVVLVRRGTRNMHRLPANYEQAMREVGALVRRPVAFLEMANMTLFDQVRVLRRTKLLVSPAGGTSFVGLFLPRGAAMLLFSNVRHDRHLDFGFYSAWSHVEVSYMLVTRKTEVGTPYA